MIVAASKRARDEDVAASRAKRDKPTSDVRMQLLGWYLGSSSGYTANAYPIDQVWDREFMNNAIYVMRPSHIASLRRGGAAFGFEWIDACMQSNAVYLLLMFPELLKLEPFVLTPEASEDAHWEELGTLVSLLAAQTNDTMVDAVPDYKAMYRSNAKTFAKLWDDDQVKGVLLRNNARYRLLERALKTGNEYFVYIWLRLNPPPGPGRPQALAVDWIRAKTDSPVLLRRVEAYIRVSLDTIRNRSAMHAMLYRSNSQRWMLRTVDDMLREGSLKTTLVSELIDRTNDNDAMYGSVRVITPTVILLETHFKRHIRSAYGNDSVVEYLRETSSITSSGFYNDWFHRLLGVNTWFVGARPASAASLTPPDVSDIMPFSPTADVVENDDPNLNEQLGDALNHADRIYRRFYGPTMSMMLLSNYDTIIKPLADQLSVVDGGLDAFEEKLATVRERIALCRIPEGVDDEFSSVHVWFDAMRRREGVDPRFLKGIASELCRTYEGVLKEVDASIEKTTDSRLQLNARSTASAIGGIVADIRTIVPDVGDAEMTMVTKIMTATHGAMLEADKPPKVAHDDSALSVRKASFMDCMKAMIKKGDGEGGTPSWDTVRAWALRIGTDPQLCPTMGGPLDMKTLDAEIAALKVWYFKTLGGT